MKVECDIEYLSGHLVGMTLKSGYSISTPDPEGLVAWIKNLRRLGTRLRAIGTGDDYVFVSDPRVVS